MKILRKHQKETLLAMSNNDEGIIHLPTGTGKTFIQANAILESLENKKVYVILTPLILLTNQIYSEIKEVLHKRNKDCQYLLVHSGSASDKSDLSYNNLPYREVKSTTSSKEIKKDYERSLEQDVPLIIFATYDSAKRIVESGIPVYMLLCDEAHNLVNEEFSWIRYEKYNDGRIQFNADRKYYFTATLKETSSNLGLGMNNSNEYGPIIYSKTPLDMITAGEILRPRMHLVDVSSEEITTELDKDVNSIIDSFIEHRTHLKIGAKMLVVTKGSEHLNDIVTHERMIEELETRPNLKIFDISSAHQPRINGIIVKRDTFLKELQSLDDRDDAIIFHVRILTEGIDVPGITGVMIMNNLSLSSFLQTLGRGTRLFNVDRKRLYEGKIMYDQLSKFVKDCAWIIVPVYGELGDDLRDNIKNMVYSLRSFGFKASEDVVIKQSKGQTLPVSLEQLNTLDSKLKSYKDNMYSIEHEIESQEESEKLILADFRLKEEIKNESLEETINRFKFV